MSDKKLNQRNLGIVSASTKTPGYDRSDIKTGIVHIGGASNFFRSHLAVYIDDLLEQGKATDFGICAVSMRSKGPVEDLTGQDCLYSVEARDTKARQMRVIGSIREARYLPDDHEYVLGVMASPDTKIFSLTVTQSGYCQNTQTGDLDINHPDIRHDLGDPRRPASAIGLIVEALNRRFEAGEKPVTVLSCDNLPENGRLLRRMVAELAERRNPALAQWIDEHVAFPVTTVDRIAPVTTDEFRLAVQRTTGLWDARPVLTEPFREFVIEDKFANDRPPFEEAGVKIVQNPDAYWNRKFRLLNAGHTMTATIAQRIGGFDHIDEAMNNPFVKGFIRHVMDHEITPTLPEATGPEIEKYKDNLIARFSNGALQDRVDRVGAEGTRKIPKYVFSALREGLHHGTPIEGLCIVAAVWIHGLNLQDEKGGRLELHDPEFDKVAEMGGDFAAAAMTADSRKMAELFRQHSDFFGPELAQSERFRTAFTKALKCVGTEPLREILKRLGPEGASPPKGSVLKRRTGQHKP